MKPSQVTFLRPVSKKSEVIRFYNLLWALVAREVKGRYRRSFLGPTWAIIQPLFYMVIFTILRGVFDISTGDVPFVLFTYSAMVPWTFFSNAVVRCSSSVTSNAGILKKMNMIREVFPAAGVLVSIFDLLISFLILLGLMTWFRVPFGLHFLWIPVLILFIGLFALGVGMGAAALGTFKRDIIFALPILLQLWMFTTPVMYSLQLVPDRWRFLFSLNPLNGLIDGFRRVTVMGLMPDLGQLSISIAGTALIWLVTWPLFRYLSQYFADVL